MKRTLPIVIFFVCYLLMACVPQTVVVPTASAKATATPVPTNTPVPTATAVETYPSSGSVEFTILHWNDFHHHLFEANPGVNWIPGAARLGGFVAAEREKRGVNQTLVLDAGDWMTMDGEYNRYMGEDQIEVYKLIGVDATVIGNHELDFRAPRLMELMERSEPIKILSINMQKTNDEGKCTTRHLADAYKIFVLGPDSGPKVRVAVVGVTATGAEWDSRNSPAKWPICFSDPTQKIIDLYSMLKETEQADIIVLLTHLGFDVDQKLAQTLIDAGTPADIIIGGHTHTCMDEPYMVGDTYIVSACELGQYVGMFDIVFDRSTTKMDVNWKTHKLTPADPVDPDITTYLQTMFPEKIESTSTPLPDGHYLIEMMPKAYNVGYGTLGKGVFTETTAGFSEGQVLFSHGISYPKGLYPTSPSRLVYDLNGVYSSFITDVAMQEGSSCGDGAEFVIQLDGQEIYTSGMLSAFHDPVHLSLDITGGKELILITLSGEDNTCDWTIWGDPYLVK